MDSDKKKKDQSALEPYSFESMADIIFRSDIDVPPARLLLTI